MRRLLGAAAIGLVSAWMVSCGGTSVPSAAPPSRSDPARTVAGAFTPPGPEQRRLAVGSLDALPGPLRRAFEEGEGSFDPVPRPDPGDWLHEHAEAFQTFDRYRAHRQVHPDATMRAIALVEIGDFQATDAPSVDALARYCEAFYGMPVRRLPPIELTALQVDARQNDGHIQLHAKQILEHLRERRPDDAYVLAAVTMYDLYPDDDWNFVYGYASGRDRVGVFSFARYDPAFFGEARSDDPSAPWRQAMLRRSVKTLSHEIGHMFGISHCTHYHCVMNGHNHDLEGRRAPMHLCPVDLRKLQHEVDFDPVQRYRELAEVDAALGFGDEVQWIEQRLAQVAGHDGSRPRR